jgi:hypothetical protein
MTVFYPSARVQLAIRVEEFADDGALVSRLRDEAGLPETETEAASAPSTDAASPATRERLESELAEVESSIATIETDPDSVTTGDPEAALVRLRTQRESLLAQLGVGSAAATPADAPPVIDGPSPDDRQVFGSIVPMNVQIERNGIRTADTASVTINYADAPFDPRLVRAAAIEITLGVVSAEDYEAGMRGERREDGSLRSLVPRSTTLAGPESRAAQTTRFVGWVDTWQIAFDQDEGDTITLECRDLSAIFFDTPLATGSGIDLTVPIDEGVRAFCDDYAPTRGIRVVYGRPGSTNPGIAPTPADSAPTTTRARRGRALRQRRSGDQQQTIWDHITEACARVGLVPIIYDYELHICEPRTFYVGEDVPRRMVYGRNLKHLEFTRKLGGNRVPTIEVRCFQPSSGRTAWARWPCPEGSPRYGTLGINDPPRTPTRPNTPGVSGHDPSERIQTYVVRGVEDGETLLGVARNIFEQTGRQEIEGNLETDDVASVESDDPADLLNLDNGDGVELLVSASQDVEGGTGMTAAQIAALTREARTDYYRALGWPSATAERFAALQDATANQTIFRAQNIRLQWDAEQGFNAVVDFINFITAREERDAVPLVDDAGTISAGSISDDSALPPDVAEDVERAPPELAADVARVYRESDLLGDAVEGGSVSPDEYADRSAALDEATPEAVEAVRTGGGTLP